MTDSIRYFHGGAPGIQPGALVVPGPPHFVDGCPVCEAHKRGINTAVDPMSHAPDRVFVTTDREYGRFYASKYLHGALYVVEPLSELVPSPHDPFPTWSCESARVRTVYDRCVELTGKQRRKLWERWTVADRERAQFGVPSWVLAPGRLTKSPAAAALLSAIVVSSVLFLASPALAAPPAPPGPLAALAHQAAVEAAAEEGDPLADLLRAVLAEELALEEPVEAEDEPAEERAEGEEAPTIGAVLAGNLVAAGWCTVYQDEPEEGAPGCDFGVGAAFWRRGRAFLAGVVGAQTVGAGFGVTAYRSRDGRVVVAGAIGIVAPYDGRGIDAGRAALAIGATFGIGGR